MKIENLLEPFFPTYNNYKSSIQELRIRVGQPLKILSANKWFFLFNDQLSSNTFGKKFTKDEIEQLLFLACDKSIYAYNSQITNGFLSIEDGVRIGVSGTVTFIDDKIYAIKNVNSLNIRIPHNICGCGEKVFPYIIKPICNTLIASPPGCGKTTLLRDLVRLFFVNNYNLLVADERNEIAAVNNGVSAFGLNCADIFTYCSKKYAFDVGIRAMSPQILFCDEISKNDLPTINNCINSGVYIVCTIHSGNIGQIKQKLEGNAVFDKYVVLSDRQGVGTVEGIYDSNFNRL